MANPRRSQLIQQCITHPTSPNLAQLRDHLLETQEADAVSHCLIPVRHHTASLRLHWDESQQDRVEQVLSAVQDVTAILRSFIRPQTPAAHSMQHIYLVSLEKDWSQVLRWICLLTDLSPITHRPLDIMKVCVEIILVLSRMVNAEHLHAPSKNMLEQLLTFPHTINRIFAFLTYSTELHGIRHLSIDGPRGFKTTQLLYEILQDDTLLLAFVVHLNSIRKSARHHILQTLISLARYVVQVVVSSGANACDAIENGASTLWYIGSCVSRLLSSSTIAAFYKKSGFVYEFCVAVHQLALHVQCQQGQHLPTAWLKIAQTVDRLIRGPLLSSQLDLLLAVPCAIDGGLIGLGILAIRSCDYMAEHVEDSLVACVKYSIMSRNACFAAFNALQQSHTTSNISLQLRELLLPGTIAFVPPVEGHSQNAVYPCAKCEVRSDNFIHRSKLTSGSALITLRIWLAHIAISSRIALEHVSSKIGGHVIYMNAKRCPTGTVVSRFESTYTLHNRSHSTQSSILAVS